MAVPGHAPIRRAPLKRHVLNVFGEREWAGFEHQDPAAMRNIVEEEGRGHDGAESTTADNDHVKSPGLSGNRKGCALGCFLQRVAKKAPHHIESKRGWFRC